MTEVKTRKKLIEVALPLDAINAASAREKSIRHGHPSTLHLWWARRPLAAARAVIFAQLVDDPSSHPERFPTTEEQDTERGRLFEIIEDLVLWENTTNEEVLEKARAEIRRSWRWTCEDNKDHPQAAELFDPEKLPAFHDPFAGGGSLPLEAQRLGLEAHASDLNPVAVLINKAMIEIPARFAGQPPVNPESQKKKDLLKRQWRGAEGLAEDVRYYGKWMRDEAEKRIGHLYPKVKVTDELVAERPDLEPYRGRELTVIAWIWARTVRSPNPAFADVDVPLASTFLLSTKEGKEAWVQPIVDNGGYRFEVRVGPPEDLEATKAGTKLGRGSNFRCLMSGIPIEGGYIKDEGKAGRMGSRLMAVVAEGDRRRIYLAPTPEHESVASSAKPAWRPEGDVPARLTGGTCVPYGLSMWGDLFTPRQLVALTTFSGLVQEAGSQAKEDALAVFGNAADQPAADAEADAGATAYAKSISTYLAIAVDKAADYNSSLVVWSPSRDQAKSTFARQALPMVWDFAEVNPLARAAGDPVVSLDGGVRFLQSACTAAEGVAQQADAATQELSLRCAVSTDPPYYDNIGYADLSDFFYVWMRRSLGSSFSPSFATLAVPKTEELVATPYRHGGREQAEAFFLTGMSRAMEQIAQSAHPAYPVSVYYAFKQSESQRESGTASTGWETFLDAVIRAGFSLSGTWPIRTERRARSIGLGTNALASSIVLACRRRPASASTASRREFREALAAELPLAVANLQRCSIAPVDLAQAAIGPGMAVFTRYSRVIESDGSELRVRAALALINRVLDESLAEQEGDFDSDTRWALAWFEEHRFGQGDYGKAETLSTAKNTSVRGIEEAGILVSKAGQVRLLKPSELPDDWDPATDGRLTTWECVHHLIRVLESEGEAAAAALVARLGPHADVARELAYRLYTICERKKWANEAKAYNGLVVSWSAIESLLGSTETSTAATPQQKELPGM